MQSSLLGTWCLSYSNRAWYAVKVAARAAANDTNSWISWPAGAAFPAGQHVALEPVSTH